MDSYDNIIPGDLDGASLCFDSEKSILWANSRAREVFPFLDAQGIGGFLSVLGYCAFEEQLKQQGCVAMPVEQRFASDTVWVFSLQTDGSVVMTAVRTVAPESLGRYFGLNSAEVMNAMLRERLQTMLADISSILRETDEKKVYDDALENRRGCYAVLRDLNNYSVVRRFYSAQLSAQYTDCDLGALLSSVCTAAAAVCRGVPQVEYEQKDRVLCRVDTGLIEIAVINLICNAFVFTRDYNHVTLTLSKTDTDAVITVSDRGEGMPTKVLGQVKQPFFSIDPNDDSSRAKGAGLGLSVAECVVQMHSGSMLVSSVRGEGTKVALRFPIVPPLGDSLKTFESANYLTDSFSCIYTGLCGFCEPSV